MWKLCFPTATVLATLGEVWLSLTKCDWVTVWEKWGDRRMGLSCHPRYLLRRQKACCRRLYDLIPQLTSPAWTCEFCTAVLSWGVAPGRQPILCLTVWQPSNQLSSSAASPIPRGKQSGALVLLSPSLHTAEARTAGAEPGAKHLPWGLQSRARGWDITVALISKAWKPRKVLESSYMKPLFFLHSERRILNFLHLREFMGQKVGHVMNPIFKIVLK